MRYRGHRLTLLVLSFIALAGLNGCAWLGLKNIPVDELRQKYATANDKYFAYKGMMVRYRDEGTGPVIILLHGVCASLETWDGWIPHLKDRYRVLRLDIPGFGITGPALGKNVCSRENAVEFLDAFITSQDIRTCSIVGNSLGGFITWNYALAHPEKVNKIILIDPVCYRQKLPLLIGFSSNPLIRPFARRMMPRPFLDGAVTQVYGDKSKVTPEIKQRYFDFAMREGNKGSYVDVFTEIRRQSISPDLPKEISAIKTPALIMWGTKDEWTSYDEMSLWKRDLPSAAFISYEGTGHIPMEEIPDITVDDALAFLQ